jgi:hypothetical protein
VELVSVVEHKLEPTKERKEMVNKETHWRVEIFQVDDVLDWKLIHMIQGDEYVSDYGHSYVVSDVMHDVGKALEGYLPEMFS